MNRRIHLPYRGDPESWNADALYAALEQFDRVLRTRCNVHLPDGTSAEAAVRHLLDLVSAFKQETAETSDRDGREGWRVALGLWDMAAKTAFVSSHPDFDQLCTHCALFLEQSRLVQNMKALSTDAISHKLFELVIALSVLQFGVDVAVDDPVRSSGGTNPDVLALVRGRRWAFACKVLNSANILTYKDLVASAVRQIERSPADHGVAVVSLTNVVDHDAFFPAFPQADGTVRYGAHESAEAMGRMLEVHVAGLLEGWEQAFGGAAGLQEIFGGKRASPVVLNYVNVTGLVMRNERPVLTATRCIVPLALGYRDDPAVYPVIELVDTAVQRPFADD